MSVAALLQDVKAAVARWVGIRGHEIEIVVSNTHDVVHADPELLRRVFEKLVDNALTHTVDAGGFVRLEVVPAAMGTIRVVASHNGSNVLVEHQDRLFDNYVRHDRDAMKTARTSVGLGLASCRMIIEAHGGRSWLEDNERQGGRFHVELPLAETYQLAASAFSIALTTRGSLGGTSGAKRSIT